MWKRWLKWCGKTIVKYAPTIAEIVMEIVAKKSKAEPPQPRA